MVADVSSIAGEISENLDTEDLSEANPEDISSFQNAFAETDGSMQNPFLNFVGGVRTQFNDQLSSISNLATTGNPGDLIRVQYAISCMIVTQDLMAKAVGKANQTLETLLKMQ